VIPSKYRKKMQEKSDRLESHNRKVRDAEERRRHAEKKHKTATTDWLGGQKEDDADKKEDESFEMKDRLDRELQEGRQNLDAHKADWERQKAEFRNQMAQMQDTFLQQCRDVIANRVPAPPLQAKPVSPKRAREESDASDVQINSKELASLFEGLSGIGLSNNV